jgi:hypothetical protein
VLLIMLIGRLSARQPLGPTVDHAFELSATWHPDLIPVVMIGRWRAA